MNVSSLSKSSLPWLAALLVAGSLGARPGIASAEPANPFGSVPSRETAAPQGNRAATDPLSPGRDGALPYSYRVALPPGRHGAAPDLTLRYSSGGALRGGLAVGWTLDLPSITKERAPSGGPQYRADIGGGSSLLVPEPGDVTASGGVAFRALHDDFTRFEALDVGDGLFIQWTARSTNGRTLTLTAPGYTVQDLPETWNATKEVDADGNQIDYTWAPQNVGGYLDWVPQQILYGANPLANLGHFAKVDFVYAPIEACPGSSVPIGARVDHRGDGLRMFGSRRLVALVVSVRDNPDAAYREVRRVDLTYDAAAMSCQGPASPLRYLKRIDEKATSPAGVVSQAPPITFSYGPASPTWSRTTNLPADGFAETGDRWGTLTRLMDVNGDGLLDQVEMITADRCTLRVRRGVFGGGFADTVTDMPLPTASWKFGDYPEPHEWCRMEGQFADRIPIGCQPETSCNMTWVNVAYTFTDWDGDGRIDVLAHGWGQNLGPDFPTLVLTDTDNNGGADQPECGSAVAVEGYCDCNEGEDITANGNGCEPHCWGHPDDCGNGGPPPGPDSPGLPDPDPNPSPFPGSDKFTPPSAERGTEPGTYRWRVFLQTEYGFEFGGPVNDAPVPLGVGKGLTAAATPLDRPVVPVFVDIDGDGLTDVVTTPFLPGTSQPDPAKTVGVGTELHVYLHTRVAGSTSLLPKEIWTLPQYPQADADGAELEVPGIGWPTGYPDHAVSYFPVMFSDVDGDGLPDLLANDTTGRLGVVYNRRGSFGPSFEPLSMAGSDPPGPWLLTPLVQKDTDYWAGGYVYEEGVQGTVSQPMDLDLDGLPDQLGIGARFGDVRDNPLGVWRGYLNLGAGPALTTALPAAWEAGKSLLVAKDGFWKRKNAVMDLTGDGVPDLVTWWKTNLGSQNQLLGGATVTAVMAEVHTEPEGAAPLRLLTSIQNGRGASTTVAYAPSTNPEVVNQGDSTLPGVKWVVRSITESAGAGQPSSTRTFAYSRPLYRAEDVPDALARFVGFGEVTEDRGSTVRAVTRLEPIGGSVRPIREETWVAPVAGAPRALEEVVTRTYQTAPLLDGKPTFTWEINTAEHRCSPGQTVSACAQDTGNARSVYTGWQGVALPGGAVGLFVQNQSYEAFAGADPKVTTRTYATFDSGSDYQVVLTGEEVTSLGGALLAKTTHEDFDAAHRPRKTRVSLSAGADAVTTRAFDAAGNVVSVKKPKQTASAGPATTIAYDAFGMYPAQTTNELGHVLVTKTDLATGALVRREGPDFRMVTPASCATPPCAQVRSYQPEVFAIDGFGRVIQHDVAVDPPAGTSGYALLTVETVTRDEVSIPNHEVVQTRLSYTGSAVRTTNEARDGLGRVISRVISGGAGSTPVTTSYHYDAEGGLAAIDLPDPRDDAATVTYTYARDGLGRVTAFTRPDGSQSISTYGPLDTTVEERSPAGVPGQKTRYVNDLAGRLVQVLEYDNPTPGAVAVTSYQYDLLGRTTQVTDPDGTSTLVTHDRAGRRTGVTRGSRTWAFAYDANGNLTSRRSPLPSPNADASLYTSTNTYDALDRVLVHTPAPRTLSASQRSAMGITPTQYTWDTSPNGLGKLATASFGFGTKTHYYDVHQRPFVESWSINVPATPSFGIQQSVTRTFTPSGLMLAEKWNDNSQWAVQYDFLDRPVKVQWLDQSLATPAWKNVAVYTRGAGGAARTRTSDYGSSRAWQYDALGRVVSDAVQVGAVTKSTRAYAFDGFGNLAAVTGQTDGAPANAAYTFDARHRLAHAAGPGSYTGTFAYSAGGNVLRATVTGASDAPDRDVEYLYGALDPQAADELDDWSTGAPVASFAYDAAGNVTSRSTASGVEQLVWDGDDVLRQVTGPAGTERYVVDHEGHRMLAIRPDGVTFWAGDNETRFTANGALLTRWLTLSAGEIVARVENKTSLEIQYADALGSVMLAVSPLGATTGSFLYGAFGEVVDSTGEASHPLQFQGKETDALTGFHYHGARYYDPLLLRWISADPLYRALPDNATSEPQRGNWYTFDLNNPLRYSDPDGRDGWEIDWSNPMPDRRMTIRQVVQAVKDGALSNASKAVVASALKPFSHHELRVMDAGAMGNIPYPARVPDDPPMVETRGAVMHAARAVLDRAAFARFVAAAAEARGVDGGIGQRARELTRIAGAAKDIAWANGVAAETFDDAMGDYVDAMFTALWTPGWKVTDGFPGKGVSKETAAALQKKAEDLAKKPGYQPQVCERDDDGRFFCHD